MSRLTVAEQLMYATFKQDFRQCWACISRGPLPYHLRRLPLQACHIVGGPGRRHDRRAIVCLCPTHHDLQHGATYRDEHGGPVLPGISDGQMEWMKWRFDNENHDAAYLRSLRIKRGLIIKLESMEVAV